MRRPFVFAALVVFFALYYYRPEDFIPVLMYLPMAKIAGVLALLALLGGMSGTKVEIPKAIKLVWILLVQMMICIPFALWPGGALHTIFDKYAKGVVVAMVISMAIVEVRELRKLLWIQASAVALVTFLSIVTKHYNEQGRLSGVQESILSNPNDLAINIAITFPLCVAFMLHTRGLKKAIWGLSLAFMSLGVVLTASRSGLLALITSIGFCVWEYGIKGKRRRVVIATAVLLVVGMTVALSSSHYRARVESIFMGNVEGSGDSGSIAARTELLKKSIWVAITHPLVGVGPGCFPIVDKAWHVAHNAYTELAAEAGIPALVLFLMIIGAAFKNIVQVRQSREYREDPEFRLFTQALWAGLAAYVIGSCFASTEYNLYPYFVVGYTCALVRIINHSLVGNEQPSESKISKTKFYDGLRRPYALPTR